MAFCTAACRPPENVVVPKSSSAHSTETAAAGAKAAPNMVQKSKKRARFRAQILVRSNYVLFEP
jgi:hypothetical protein